MAADPLDLPGFDDIVAAANRIGPRIARTPVVNSPAFDSRVGCKVYFKCENLQHGGAFKYRGALNAVLSLVARERVEIVATHSSGNHGTAVALAARACGLRAHVIVPKNAARVKVAAIERAGGEVEYCEPGIAAREAALREYLQRMPARVVHPFDDSSVIAGQGTAALELLGDVPDLDAVCVPVGGGGLIGGTALAVKGVAPRCAVVGAEPEEADDAFRSFRSGVRQSVTVPKTIADGLCGSIGVRNFELLRRHVDDVVTVSEPAIVEAMRVVLEDLKLLIEPSSAVAVAALLGGHLPAGARRVGIVLSGGNVDLERCPFLRGERLS